MNVSITSPKVTLEPVGCWRDDIRAAQSSCLDFDNNVPAMLHWTMLR